MNRDPRLQYPEIADIPAAGTRISAGQPIATVFGLAISWGRLQLVLSERLQYWQALLLGSKSTAP